MGVAVPILLSGFMCLLVLYLWKMKRFIYTLYSVNAPAALFDFSGKGPDVLKIFEKLSKIYSVPGRAFSLDKRVVFVEHPDDVQVILNDESCFLKDKEGYKYFMPFTGEGLVTCTDVSRWRKARKLIAPISSATTVSNFIPIFQKHAIKLCEKLDGMVEKSDSNIVRELRNCHLASTCENTLGVKPNEQHLEENDYIDWVNRLFSMTFKRSIHPLLHNNFIFKLTEDSKKVEKLVQCVRNFNDEIIKLKNKQRKDINASAKSKAFLDRLMETEELQITDEYLNDEVGTALFGATGSSAATEAFLFMILGIYPEIQDKILEEQHEILGNTNRSITSDDIAQMKYLECVLKETLRLFPPVPFPGRTAMKDLKLRNCIVPKGTSCILSVYFLHRNPEFWENPQEFQPDRFLPDDVARRHPYAWLPFSAGPRGCPGAKYAMTSMKTLVSIIVRRYKIFCCDYKSLDEIKISAQGVLEPADGFKMRLELRKASE